MTKKAKKVSAEELESALDTIEKLTIERDEYLAKYQRAHADCQNIRRRAGEDIEDRVKRRLQPLLEELLLVLDNLEMALMCPAESQETKNLYMGVKMTRDQLLTALGSEDVQRIVPAGAFDPAQHQAMEVVEDTDAPPGHVVDVTRHGYTWRDNVLRSAQVRVAPGTPEKPAADESPEETPEEPLDEPTEEQLEE
jgi:molecular chaperone GrpE